MEKPYRKEMENEIPEDMSLGVFLKRSREERNIELDEVTEATRIRRHNLEAIENDEWSKLPPQVFIKGFLKSYAAFLGLDRETVLHHYQRTSSFEKNTPEARKKIGIQQGRPYLIIVVPVLALVFIIALIYLNKRNISVTDRAFQYLGTQSLEKTMESMAERVDNEVQDEREKEKLLLLEDDGVVEELNKTTLKPKPINDTIVLEHSTIPVKREEEEKKPLLPRLILTANVKSRTWIAISIDDMPGKEYLFQPGQTPRWTAEKGFDILVGNAAGIEFSLNGKEVGNLGTQGQVVRIKLPDG